MREPLRTGFISEADCSVCRSMRCPSEISDRKRETVDELNSLGWEFKYKRINGKLVAVHATCPDCAEAADVAKKLKATALKDAREARKAARTQADDTYKTAVGKLSKGEANGCKSDK